MLKPNSTWFDNPHGITRPSITKITIVDSYTPTGSEKSWDCSAEQDGSIKCYVTGTELTIAGNGSGKIKMNPDSSLLFYKSGSDKFENVTDILGINLFDSFEVTTLYRSFREMKKLVSLDLSSWDVPKLENVMTAFAQMSSIKSININWSNCTKVNDMRGLIQLDGELTEIDISSWNLSHVTSMHAVFSTCRNLKTISMSDTLKVNTSCRQTFKDCASLTSVIGIKHIVGKTVTTVSGMFSGCTAMKEVDCADWDMSNIQDASGMFYSCTSLVAVDVSRWRFGVPNQINDIFHNCFSLKTITVSNWDVSKTTHMRSAFTRCSQLTELNLSNWNTSSVTDMSFMFFGCSNLNSLDIFNWDVSKVENFSQMFAMTGGNGGPAPSKLTELDVSNWDTKSAQDMSFMFYGSAIKTLDVSNWDVSHVTKFDHFMAHSGMRLIGVENWKVTSACTHTGAMFYSCANEVIDISGWDFTNVKTTNQMFEGCGNLKRIIGIEKMATPNNIGSDEMFLRCHSLEELDLSDLDTRKAHDGTVISSNGGETATCMRIFSDMPKLRKLTLGPNFSYNGDGTSTDPSHYAIMPTPDDPAYDGHWYNQSGEALLPEDACKKVPVTLYATKERMRSEPVLLQNGTLIDIGEAVRNKKADNLHRKPSEMKAAIDSIAMPPNGNDLLYGKKVF